MIKRSQLKLMQQHAVLVDVAIDQGGCFETSQADHPSRSHLRGRRGDPLLRHQHARRGADHVHLRAHQRNPALRARAGRPRRRRGRTARPGPEARDQRRRRQGHPPGRGRGRGHGLCGAGGGARRSLQLARRRSGRRRRTGWPPAAKRGAALGDRARRFLFQPAARLRQGSREQRRSRRIRLAALWPAAAITPPPGWVPAPQR